MTDLTPDATPDTIPAPGRPVRLVPVAPGFWMTTLGVCVAALAPLFGFLVGVMSRSSGAEGAFSPLYGGLFAGVVLGGLGVLAAILGGLRLWRHHQGTKV